MQSAAGSTTYSRRVASAGSATERPLSANAATATASATELTSMREIREDFIAPLMEKHPYLDGWQKVYVVAQAEHEIPLGRVNWFRLLVASYPEGKELVKSVATFFPKELDPNYNDKPRLDIVLTFDDGTWTRYYPGAALIWSTEQSLTDAMQNRINYTQKKLIRRRNVDTRAMLQSMPLGRLG